MGKNRILLLCLALILAFSGCTSAIPAETTTAPTQNTAEEVPTTSPTQEIRYDPSSWPKLQLYVGEPLIEKVSDGDVYISLQNQNCDFYPDTAYNGVAFDVITRNHYEPEEIRVAFPGKTKCEIRITERSGEFRYIALNPVTGSYNIDGQQPYHYLCLQGIDLQALGQQASDARLAADAYASLVQNERADAEDYAALVDGYVTPYDLLLQDYLDSYAAQGQEPVTEYYAYTVNLIFNQKKYVEETIESIDVFIGEISYHVPFGQWRIHAEPRSEDTQTPKGIEMETVAIMGASGDSPYADGYMKLNEAVHFRTKDDLILTGLRYDSDVHAEVLGAKIESTSPENSVDFFWNGKDPIKLESGADLVVTVYLYSDSFMEYEMSMTGALVIEYALASTGAEYSASVPCKISRYNKLWDTYCLAFLGVDVGEYYHYFRDEIMEIAWISELPEGWRKG